MVATVSHDAFRRLAVADRILDDPELIENGSWPRVCTWLIRLALEHGLDDFWAERNPAMIQVSSRRAQLLTLTRTVDSDLGFRATALWHTLSRAAHHHAYELAPTGTELRSWHSEVTELVVALSSPTSRSTSTTRPGRHQRHPFTTPSTSEPATKPRNIPENAIDDE